MRSSDAQLLYFHIHTQKQGRGRGLTAQPIASPNPREASGRPNSGIAYKITEIADDIHA
jgi:hypothetical protein